MFRRRLQCQQNFGCTIQLFSRQLALVWHVGGTAKGVQGYWKIFKNYYKLISTRSSTDYKVTHSLGTPSSSNAYTITGSAIAIKNRQVSGV